MTWLAAWAGCCVGVPLGVHLGWLYWHAHCAECRYRLGSRLADEARRERHWRRT